METALYVIFIIISVIFYKPGGWTRRNMFFGYSYMNDDDYADSRSLFDKWMESNNKKKKRKRALKKAERFLKPYKNLFGKHCLSNQYCQVNLQMTKEKTMQVFCISKVPINNQEKPLFIAEDINFDNDMMNDFWDTLCLVFNENTNYQMVYVECSNKYLKIKSAQMDVKEKSQENQIKVSNSEVVKPAKIIDINNATETEIAELPGVSIIIAKKIIVEREKKPFDSVDEFFARMPIQSNFKEKLRPKICVNEVKVIKVDKTNIERIVDI